MNTLTKIGKKMGLQKVTVKKAGLFLLAVFMTAASAFSQSSAYSGKEFLVAFGNNNMHSDLRYQNQGVWDTVQLILRITAIEDAKVTIKFNNGTVPTDEVLLKANEIHDYILSYAQALASYTGKTMDDKMKSIEVSSTGAISLIAVNTADRSTEATLVIPVENLGTEYIHSSLSHQSSAQSGFIIIATADNTVVNFGSVTGGGPPVPYTLKKRGEVYVFYKEIAMWSMTVSATKPIAYFLNAPRVRLVSPSGSSLYRENFNFEQLIPVNQWGTKFIVPTFLLEYADREGVFARVTAPEPTNIKITYTDGTTTTVNQKWYDLRIDNGTGNHGSAKAAYITTEKPASVNIYHAPHDYVGGGIYGDASQPGVAVLPPVEQMVRSALIAPLDLDGDHIFLKTKHDFILITPWATRNNTTISINGGAPQNINTRSEFKWISENVGGSGYAVGRYQFGHHFPQEDVFLNTTALVENPDGFLLMAYGQGSYTNYVYTVGAAARSLDMMGYVNGIHFDDANGQTFCNTFVYDIMAVSNLPKAQGSSYPKWYFNGEYQSNLDGHGLGNDMITEIWEEEKDYHIKMVFLDANGQENFRETTITVAATPSVKPFSLQSFCDKGAVLNPDTPVEGSSTVGWQLETGVGTGQYNKINIPYPITLSDNGKRVRYYVENGCGAAYSATQTIVITTSVTPEVEISGEKE